MTRVKKWIIVLAGVMVVFVAGATAANAVLIGRIGTTTVKQQFAHETVEWSTSSSTWVDVPGAGGSVSLGATGFIDARFSAESLCSGGSWCSIRLVTIQPQPFPFPSILRVMDPVSDTDFAFDSPGTSWKSLAVERTSNFMLLGTYQVKVQAAVVGGSYFRLDDWTFAVSVINP